MGATLYALPDEKQIAEDRKADAKKHYDALRKAGAMESTSTLKIGFHAHYLKANNLFGMLGFESEDDAREASGVGRSTWYSVVRLAESFNGLEEEQFTSMKLANAQALADLPESKRLSREWIRMAGSMAISEFAEKVDAEMDGKARSSDGKEQSTSFKLSMPKSRKKVVDAGLHEYAEKLGLGEDTSRALEVMVAEHTGQGSLVGSITTAVQRIKAARDLQHSGLSADEILAKVYEDLDQLILDFADALAAVQNLDSQTIQ